MNESGNVCSPAVSYRSLHSDKLLITCTSCVLFMYFVFFLFQLFLAISQNITQIKYTLAYGQHAKWVWCYDSTITTNIWTMMKLTFHHNFYVTWQWQQTCSGLMYKCVPTRAVCLSSACCVYGTSELGVLRFESFSTIAVTNPKSPTLIWPSSEKNMFDGCKLKWGPCNDLATKVFKAHNFHN